MAGALLYDMVKETATTTGTGTLTLLGAEIGYRSFSVVGNGNTCYYTIRHQTADEWEVGIGTYTSAGTTLARTTILASSNGGAAVNFSAGTKDVILSAPAALVGITGLTTATPADDDEVAIYDTSATAVRKATVGDIGGMWKKLSTATASASATVDFTLPAGYVAFKVVFSHVAPATDATSFFLRTSTDGGSSYDAGVSDYDWAALGVATNASTTAAAGDAADSEITLNGSTTCGNAANETSSGWVLLLNPSAAQYGQAQWMVSVSNTAGVLVTYFGGGRRLSAADVDAIRFMFSSGNIASGQFDLFGMKA